MHVINYESATQRENIPEYSRSRGSSFQTPRLRRLNVQCRSSQRPSPQLLQFSVALPNKSGKNNQLLLVLDNTPKMTDQSERCRAIDGLLTQSIIVQKVHITLNTDEHYTNFPFHIFCKLLCRYI